MSQEKQNQNRLKKKPWNQWFHWKLVSQYHIMYGVRKAILLTKNTKEQKI